jgi:hypothetical protein
MIDFEELESRLRSALAIDASRAPASRRDWSGATLGGSPPHRKRGVTYAAAALILIGFGAVAVVRLTAVDQSATEPSTTPQPVAQVETTISRVSLPEGVNDSGFFKWEAAYTFGESQEVLVGGPGTKGRIATPGVDPSTVLCVGSQGGASVGCGYPRPGHGMVNLLGTVDDTTVSGVGWFDVPIDATLVTLTVAGQVLRQHPIDRISAFATVLTYCCDKDSATPFRFDAYDVNGDRIAAIDGLTGEYLSHSWRAPRTN